MTRKRICSGMNTLAAVPMVVGMIILVVGFGSLFWPILVSVKTGVEPNFYIESGRYLLLGSYEAMISFISLGLMLVVFGILFGGTVVCVIEPVVRHLKKA